MLVLLLVNSRNEGLFFVCNEFVSENRLVALEEDKRELDMVEKCLVDNGQVDNGQVDNGQVDKSRVGSERRKEGVIEMPESMHKG